MSENEITQERGVRHIVVATHAFGRATLQNVPLNFFNIFQRISHNLIKLIQNYSEFFKISFNWHFFFQYFLLIFSTFSDGFLATSLKYWFSDGTTCVNDVYWASLLKCLIGVSTHGCHQKLPMTKSTTDETIPYTFGVAPLGTVAATCVSHVNTRINVYTKLCL